jgi:hypothetical protein
VSAQPSDDEAAAAICAIYIDQRGTLNRVVEHPAWLPVSPPKRAAGEAQLATWTAHEQRGLRDAQEAYI